MRELAREPKWGLVGAYKKGHYNRCPFGYTKDGKKVIVDENLRDIVREIFKMYLQGKSAGIIRKYINEVYHLELTTKKVENMVKQKIYAGLIDIEEKEVDDVIEGIITIEEWEKCKEQFKMNQERQMRKEHYIFLQKIKCPVCGKIMGGTHSIGARGKKTYWYYQCSSCNIRNLNEEVIEKKVINDISEIIDYYMIADVATIYTPKQKGSFINSINIAIKDAVEKTNKQLEEARRNATNMLINAMGGYVVKTREELYIMDNDNPSTEMNRKLFGSKTENNRKLMI